MWVGEDGCEKNFARASPDLKLARLLVIEPLQQKMQPGKSSVAVPGCLTLVAPAVGAGVLLSVS